MTEVTVSRVEGVYAPNSLLQVKVGTVAKQVGVLDKRALRFPGTTPMVEVEILSAVARCRVKLNENQEAYRVSLGDLNVNLNVKDIKEGVERPDSPNSKRLNQALSARSYLEENWEAMQAVQDMLQAIIKEKPKDPYTYMASYFSKIAVPEENMTEVPIDRKAVENAEAEKAHAEAEKAQAKAQIEAQAEVKNLQDKLWEQKWEMNELHREIVELKKPPPEPLCEPLGFAARPSVGTWLVRPLEPEVSPPFEPRTPPKDAFFHLPSAGGLARPKPLKLRPAQPLAACWAVFPASAPEQAQYNRLPSVGTWLASTPLQNEKERDDTPGSLYNRLPSVGTWLASTPPRKNKQETIVEERTFEEKKQLRLDALKRQQEEGDWSTRPSVGTWIMKPKFNPLHAVAREKVSIDRENAALLAEIEALRREAGMGPRPGPQTWDKKPSVATWHMPLKAKKQNIPETMSKTSLLARKPAASEWLVSHQVDDPVTGWTVE